MYFFDWIYMADLETKLCGLTFRNPVIAASGTFGFGREYAEYMDLNALGGVSVKGLTLKPRRGNPPPRIAETAYGVLNSVGLQNPGVMSFINDELPFLRSFPGLRVIANAAGETPDEYRECVRALSDSDVDAVELNVSCPNVECGGLAFGTDKKILFDIVSLVRPVCKKPLIVKLSPNVTDIRPLAKAAEAAGADAISLINTLVGMKIDVGTRRPALANNTGGLSGPAVKPVAVRMTWEAASAVRIPVIGMGGVTTGEDAVEFMLAGASAVMVGTASFIEPDACARVVAGIDAYLTEHGCASCSELVGGVILWD